MTKRTKLKKQTRETFEYYGDVARCFNCEPAALNLTGSPPKLRVIEGGRNTLDDMTALRLQLMWNGYLPIPLFGKDPTLPRWSALEAVNRKHVEMYAKQWPDAVNTGGVTRRTPAIDNDILHPEAARALEDLVRKYFEERGRIMVRIGLAPKHAVLLRTKKPFPKITRLFEAPDGSTQKIEILCDGQQVVLFGIHPDTHQPYRWHGGDPATVARSELPEVERSDLEKYLDAATKLLVEEFGFKFAGERHSKKREQAAPNKKAAPGEFDPFMMSAPTDRETAWAEAALQGSCEEMRAVGKGDRNNTLYRKAFRMGTMIVNNWIEHDRVVDALIDAAANYIDTEKNGERTARRTIKSGIEDGLDSPHDALPNTNTAPMGVGKTLPPPVEGEWPTLEKEALHGLPGKVVALYDPHTEADPVAILIQFLVCFGNALDRGPFYLAEDTEHFTNLFAVLVGKTSKARKGTSGDRIHRLMRCVDPYWEEHCVTGGLASGEGAIWAIRDKEQEVGEDGNVDFFAQDTDKRLLFDEREFSKVLTVMQRDGSTVSQVARNAWDGRDLSIVTKNNPIRATKPMISIVGHITEDELRGMLDLVSIANGYTNRFLFNCVRRSKILPHGGNLSQSEIEALGKEIQAIFIKWHAVERRIMMDAQAYAMWGDIYAELSREQPGLLGAITGRAEAQTIRLALLYAVLDDSEQIRVVHLHAALAVWRYCEDSARYIFGDSLGDPDADDLLRALRTSDGMSRTQIRDHFGRNKNSNQIDRALALLKKLGRVHCEKGAAGARGGPRPEIWVANMKGRK
jgi:hypothetical protein